MDEELMELRVRDILNRKAALGYGYDDDDDDYDDYDDDIDGGVLVGGRRRRRRYRRRARRRRSLYGYGDDLDDDYGEGVLVGGVPVGGYRRRRRSSWNRAVSEYMRLHPSVSLAEAAHVLSRRRRRRRGGVRIPDYMVMSRAERLRAKADEKKERRKKFCDTYDERVKKAKTLKDLKRLEKICKKGELQRRKANLLKFLREEAAKGAEGEPELHRGQRIVESLQEKVQ
jgi:hypothetical protein